MRSDLTPRCTCLLSTFLCDWIETIAKTRGERKENLSGEGGADLGAARLLLTKTRIKFRALYTTQLSSRGNFTTPLPGRKTMRLH